MARLLLGTPDAAGAANDAAAARLARAGRQLRDAGHEVVHAGAGLAAADLAAAAVQEDVDAVLLLTGAAGGAAEPAGDLPARLAAAGADDVRVLVAGPDDAVADLLTGPDARSEP